jgi:transcriptional regulator with XRE-family HTH domain
MSTATPAEEDTFLFRFMFGNLCRKNGNKAVAELLDFSEQYVSDLLNGRRLPSLEVIERLCAKLACTIATRRQWHKAGARAHGWKL